jgi:hypothetical protein
MMCVVRLLRWRRCKGAVERDGQSEPGQSKSAIRLASVATFGLPRAVIEQLSQDGVIDSTPSTTILVSEGFRGGHLERESLSLILRPCLCLATCWRLFHPWPASHHHGFQIATCVANPPLVVNATLHAPTAPFPRMRIFATTVAVGITPSCVAHRWSEKSLCLDAPNTPCRR